MCLSYYSSYRFLPDLQVNSSLFSPLLHKTGAQALSRCKGISCAPFLGYGV